MTATVALCALLVGVAAAVRSTWSPCGLSMLSTITPFAERAKRHRYGATCTWFVIGATVGGLAFGALAASAAAVVGHLALSATSVALVGAGAALVALVSDAGVAGIRLPVHYRQVNERWLDAYRPWVYGAGFGAQIGCGVATYITTATVYLFVVLCALTGSPVTALALGALFGLVRGLAVLCTRRVTTPQELLDLHRRVASALPVAVWAVRATAAVVAAWLALRSGPVAGAVAVVAVGTVVVGLALRRRRADRLAAGTGPGPVGPVPAGDDRDRSVPVG